MKMTDQEREIHQVQLVSDMCCHADANIVLGGKTISKITFRGSDLLIGTTDGRNVIFSAVENENTGKPHLEMVAS